MDIQYVEVEEDKYVFDNTIIDKPVMKPKLIYKYSKDTFNILKSIKAKPIKRDPDRYKGLV